MADTEDWIGEQLNLPKTITEIKLYLLADRLLRGLLQDRDIVRTRHRYFPILAYTKIHELLGNLQWIMSLRFACFLNLPFCTIRNLNSNPTRFFCIHVTIVDVLKRHLGGRPTRHFV